MSTHSVIEFKNVSVTYDHRAVLNNINFSLENGEFAYLIGQTGAGKSSFLRLIYRDLVPDHGSIQVADYDVASLPNSKVPYLRRRLGIVFQDFQLLPDRTVYENVAFSMKVIGAKSSYIKQRVLEVLGMVGLSHKRKSMPEDLSGGEQQRVVIARSLANEPRIMLADEPTGNLDPEASASIMELLQKINNRGMAVLMVTHDYDTVRDYPHRTLKLQDGSIAEVEPRKLGKV
ncbi:cell division ATP-binding protein FtsE [Fodinibius salsisoli]|uniref:Cell division ATP-binding protein FtsE n=1 Tax=Fodinibius salsisoli TaxID=2820877 RepID=A0ABT3PQV2_9BACT|nr:cell division ATP-binding protein FtsE [Fodinibius salsisoli]MCW9708233.1 cell division ATP-binding protein FtsE [Fodinibius salsisoli]